MRKFQNQLSSLFVDTTMDKKDQAHIQGNLARLSEVTEWSATLEDKLLQTEVFTRRTFIDQIKTKSGADRLRQLYTDVQKRGPKAYARLVDALVQSGNGTAARILDPNAKTPIPPQLTLPRATTTSQPINRESKVWSEPKYDDIDATASGFSSTAAAVGSYSSASPYFDIVDERTPIEVEVKLATEFRGPPQYKAYPMTRPVRGRCLIINNETFENDVLPQREGSLIDANNLDILFTQLGFKCTLRHNLKYGQIMKELTAFSEMPEHEAGDMCIVAILSHGDDGLIFSSDGRKISTEWLLGRFNNDGCPALKGKPKFFLLQACRGDEPDFGVVSIPKFIDSDAIDATDAQRFRPSAMLQNIKEPTWEDILVAYATLPGFVANRNLYRGTWFIELICKTFMEQAHEMDIRDMLDEVCYQMSFYESECGTKQSSLYEVRHFYKKLYFNPGITEDTNEKAAASAKWHQAEVARLRNEREQRLSGDFEGITTGGMMVAGSPGAHSLGTFPMKPPQQVSPLAARKQPQQHHPSGRRYSYTSGGGGTAP